MTQNATQEDPATQRLARLDCCAVSDALDQISLKDRVVNVPKRSGQATSICGRVTTLKLHDGPRPDGPVRHLGTQAVELSGPGQVIVVEQRTGIDAGCWGGILTLGAKLRGVAGVVADGPVRDIDEALTYDFPIFSTALTARTARGRVVEAETNGPISPWGIPVVSGDYVIADSSAVIFIPADQIEPVLDAAEKIATKEAAMAKALLAGTPITEVMGASYEDMLTETSK